MRSNSDCVREQAGRAFKAELAAVLAQLPTPGLTEKIFRRGLVAIRESRITGGIHESEGFLGIEGQAMAIDAVQRRVGGC